MLEDAYGHKPVEMIEHKPLKVRRHLPALGQQAEEVGFEPT